MWQPWVPHVDCVRLLELHGLTGIGAFVAAGATGCAICRGWIATSCWPHHLGDERVALLSNENPGHFTCESCGVIHECLGFCQWSIEDNGNEHFAAVFLDQGWSARLHLCKNRYRFVFAQSAFPFLELFVPGCQFVVGPCELSAFPVHE